MLAEDTLCHRRERVLLACSAAMAIAAVLLVAIGADVSISLAELSPIAITPNALIPAGALAVPLGILAVMLATEVLGARSARALVGLGIVAMAISLAVIGALGRGASEIALCAGFAAATLVTVELFRAIGSTTRGRKLALRYVASSLIGCAVGGIAIAAVSVAFPIGAGMTSNAVALNVAGYAFAIVIVAALPMILAIKGAAIALRTRPFRQTFTTEEVDCYEATFLSSTAVG